MKKIQLISAFIICTLISFSAESQYSAERTVNKTFTNADDLEVNNKYGNIVIRQWDKNEIFVEAIIKGESKKSQSEAQEFINSVQIELKQVGNKVFASTVYSAKTWDNINRQVTYNIHVPKNTSFIVYNKYGNVDLDKSNKSAYINVKYGSVTISNLEKQNTITVGYGNITVSEAADINLFISYGKIDINTANKLTIDSKYTGIRLGTLNSLQLTSKYDNLKIEEVKNVTINTSYTPVNIKQLGEDANITNKYGQINIQGISKDTKELNLRTGYSSITLNLGNYGYTLTASNKYGQVNLPRNAETIKSIVESNSIYKEVARGDRALKISLTNSYGKINVE